LRAGRRVSNPESRLSSVVAASRSAARWTVEQVALGCPDALLALGLPRRLPLVCRHGVGQQRVVERAEWSESGAVFRHGVGSLGVK